MLAKFANHFVDHQKYSEWLWKVEGVEENSKALTATGLQKVLSDLSEKPIKSRSKETMWKQVKKLHLGCIDPLLLAKSVVLQLNHELDGYQKRYGRDVDAIVRMGERF